MEKVATLDLTTFSLVPIAVVSDGSHISPNKEAGLNFSNLTGAKKLFSELIDQLVSQGVSTVYVKAFPGDKKSDVFREESLRYGLEVIMVNP